MWFIHCLRFCLRSYSRYAIIAHAAHSKPAATPTANGPGHVIIRLVHNAIFGIVICKLTPKTKIKPSIAIGVTCKA